MTLVTPEYRFFSVNPACHLALGEALSPLRREGVLVMGSGGAVHPLGDPTLALGEGCPTDRRAIVFNEWLDRAVTAGDTESLVSYRTLVPSAVHAQSYPDHFMPLLMALGAAGPGAKGTHIHQSSLAKNRAIFYTVPR